MGKIFLEYVEAPDVQVCAGGRAPRRRTAIISKAFQGRHGRANLFSDVVNVNSGPTENRLLLTGLHVVADIYCNGCETRLGWKYVRRRGVAEVQGGQIHPREGDDRQGGRRGEAARRRGREAGGRAAATTSPPTRRRTTTRTTTRRRLRSSSRGRRCRATRAPSLPICARSKCLQPCRDAWRATCEVSTNHLYSRQPESCAARSVAATAAAIPHKRRGCRRRAGRGFHGGGVDLAAGARRQHRAALPCPAPRTRRSKTRRPPRREALPRARARRSRPSRTRRRGRGSASPSEACVVRTVGSVSASVADARAHPRGAQRLELGGGELAAPQVHRRLGEAHAQVAALGERASVRNVVRGAIQRRRQRQTQGRPRRPP